MGEDRLERLIDAVASGEADAVEALSSHLATTEPHPAALLLRLMGHPSAAVRVVGIGCAIGSSDPTILAALSRLSRDRAREVRLALAAHLANGAWRGMAETTAKLLEDDDAAVRSAAVRAAAEEPTLLPRVLARLREDSSWEVRRDAAVALQRAPAVETLPDLVQSLATDTDDDVGHAAARSADRLLQGLAVSALRLDALSVGVLEEAKVRVSKLGPSPYPRLMGWLSRHVSTRVNPERLRDFGTDLTVQAQEGRLPRAHRIAGACEALEKVLLGDPPRGAVLLGPPGSGKTAIVQELVHRLRGHPDGPWHVVRIQPSELLAGTLYLGEWQTKIQKLVEAVRHPRRAVLYFPNLDELAWVGRSAQSDLNVATMLAPHIESGAISVVGESTPEAFRTGLGALASVRRLFQPIEVRESSAEETRAILRAVRDERAPGLPDADLDRVQELAAFYLPGTAEPGRAVGLLRRVLDGVAGGAPLPTGRDVLRTLSVSTGIPMDLLDDEVPLDLARVRTFFEARVMGQPEAVGAISNLVALVKAGLTDPSKPFGVLLFVGPTGVGKTELARSLAEFLFGDPARLLRFDMSEYALPDAHERLIGWGARPGQLTSAVREQPFAVVLLDEVEKAHPSVFDLCLQVFDAGRLTDAQGRTADFRRSIVIMTSNIGSAVATEGTVGFGGAEPRPPDPEDALREVRRFFRPEFLNRIDQFVLFSPLAPETAEEIARREVRRVLERAGLKRRRLSLDLDPAVLPLLLRRGYSPAFGARPLKRTVERFVLLPVARAIAQGAVPAGSVLRLTARGDEVLAEVVPSEAPEGAPAPASPSVPPSGPARRLEALRARLAGLAEAEAACRTRRDALFARTRSSDLWKDGAGARRDMEEFRRLESILEARDRLDRRLREATEQRWDSANAPRAARIHERLEGIERELRIVEFLLRCRDPRDLGDALLLLSPVRSEGKPLDALGRLGQMYLQFAARRGYETEVLDDRRTEDPAEDGLTVLVSGPGAYGLLARESGIHQVGRVVSDAGTQGRRRTDREFVRVEVLPLPAEEPGGLRAETRSRFRPRAGSGRFLGPPLLEATLLHERTMTSIRAVTAGKDHEAAWTRLLPLLQARLAPAPAASPSLGGVLRRYALGPSGRVRDRRSGTDTGNVERVLRGEIDEFLLPDAGSVA